MDKYLFKQINIYRNISIIMLRELGLSNLDPQNAAKMNKCISV